MTFKQKLIIVCAAGLVVFGLDQGTKIWARATLLTQTQRQAVFAETQELFAKGEIQKTPSGKRYRVHPYDPSRGKQKIKSVKRDGKQTFVKAVGDRPGPRMWFILSFNPGAAFGLFNDTAGSRVFLSITGLLALALIFYLLRRPESDSKLFVWALAMVAGGAVGNLVDRIFYGVVTDFIWVWLTPGWRMVWPWPAFNIADIALVVGVGLMVPAMLFAKPEESSDGAEDKAAAGGADDKSGAGRPGGTQADKKADKRSSKRSARKSGGKSGRRSGKRSSR